MDTMTKHHVSGRQPSYHHRAAVTGTSEPLVIPNESRGVVVGVVPTVSAAVQVSISTLADIAADNAIWFDWGAGDVANPTIDFVDFNVTAVRLVSDGETTWEVTA